MKSSGIGGQAVIEGVMMKNGNDYAVAVRKPNKEIAVEVKHLSKKKSNPILKLPIIRGVMAFVESLSLGMKSLTFSSSFFEEEEEESKFEKKLNEITKGKGESIINTLIVCCSGLIAIGIFVVLPMLLASFLSSRIENSFILALLEGVFRLLIFLVYIGLISQMEDIKRVFMYHGAEHKSINCIENGIPLTLENVRKQSREHKRCGTSFMLNVMLISIIFFMFIRVEHTLLRFVLRLLLIPVIAGISYEFIRFAGRSDSKIMDILSRPGMWLQSLTTKEPDDSMIEVAIASVEAIFDWKSFQEREERRETRRNKKEELNIQENEPQLEYAVSEEKEEIEDVALLYDMKLTGATKEIKRGKTSKKDPLPLATKAVSETNKDKDDSILNSLDMYFKFDGKKSVMEISDEEVEEDATNE